MRKTALGNTALKRLEKIINHHEAHEDKNYLKNDFVVFVKHSINILRALRVLRGENNKVTITKHT
jgi:hypothetical protein